MSFQDIKGEDTAISFLKNAVSGGRVASAYIFAGPSGCGKKLTALNFAKLLNCAEPSGVEPCDKCPSCLKIDSASCPDVKVFEKDQKKTEFGIDIVLEAIRSISLKPYEAKKKVYIIDEADHMSEEASNAVLKTLEEPPQNSVLILVAEDLGAISQTIRSRSQLVKFFPMPAKEIEAILERGYKVPSASARVLSGLSLGSVGLALERSKNGFLDERERVIDGLNSGRLFESDFEKMKRSDFIGCLDVMLSWYRDILVTKARGDDADGILNIDKKDDIARAAKKKSFEYLDGAVKAIAEARWNLERNANPKLAMSVLGIRLEEKG